MDINLVPTAGEFPVRKVGERFEFAPPLRLSVGNFKVDLHYVDEDYFIVERRKGRWIAIPRTLEELVERRSWGA